MPEEEKSRHDSHERIGLGGIGMHELGHRVLLLHRWDTGKASGTWSEGRLLASIQAVNSFGHNVAVAFTFLLLVLSVCVKAAR
jgi:hypothetical protein